MNVFTFWRAWLHTENITLLGRLFPLLIWCDATFSHESPIHASLSSKGTIVRSLGYFLCDIFLVGYFESPIHASLSSKGTIVCSVEYFLWDILFFFWDILSHRSMLPYHQRAQSCALWDIFRTFLLLILTSRSNTQTILFENWFVWFTFRTWIYACSQ